MRKLGKYEIEAKLGEGAMGFVYKAWHPGFNDYVALKTIQNTAGGGQLIEWFKFEARTLAKLKHPNIVQIYEVEEDQGINFIVMEYLNGGSLDRLIEKREDVPLAKRVGYVASVCRALDHAHRRKVFHRDIKPANIMLHYDGDDEIVKVVDFGIARLVDFSKTLTNWQVGAPAYMAPELLTASTTANEKTDIWAVGVTLYELIAYQRPFRGDSVEEIKRNAVNYQPVPLSQLSSECPADLEAIVFRLLEKQPERRYQTVEDVLLDLEPVAKALGTQTAEAFLRRAEDLYELNDFDGARTNAKRALQYDSANTHARSLLQRTLEEIRRREVVPRLQEHLKKARDFLEIGQIEEAREEVQSALGLDSRFEPILKLREEIEEAAARAQLVDQKLKATEQRLSEGALTQAEALLGEVEKLDLLNPHVKELRRQLEDERQRRARRKRLNQALNQARTLQAEGELEESLNVLQNAHKEFPAEPELNKLRSVVRAELAQIEKQRERDKTISEVRKAIASELFGEALAKIQDLSREYPNDVVLQNLETLAADGLREQEKRKQLEEDAAEIRALLTDSNYGQVIKKGEAVLKNFPQEYELRKLVDYARNELHQRDLQRQSEKESSIRQLLKKEQYDEALRAATSAGQEFPRLPVFRELVEEAKQQIQNLEEKGREELKRGISTVKELLSSGNLDGAEALLNHLPLGPTASQDISIRQIRDEINDRRKQVAQLERQKSQHRDALFQEANTLMEKNDFGGVTRILEEIRKVDSKGLDEQRFTQLQSDIDARRREAELRERKEREREKAIKTSLERRFNEVRQLLAQNRIEEASQLLASSLQDGLLNAQDERILQLRKDLEDKKKLLQLEAEEKARKRRNQETIISKVKDLIARQEFVEADQVLSQAISESILPASHDAVHDLRQMIQEEAARAKQREQAERARQESQDRCLNEAHELIVGGKFADAAQMLDLAVADSLLSKGDKRVKLLRAAIEEESRLAEIRSKELERKRNLQARCLGEVAALLQGGDTLRAARLLDEALRDAILPASDPRVSRLRDEIRQEEQRRAALQQEEQKQRKQKIDQKRQEAREALDRGDYQAALRIANEGQAEFGLDRELSDLGRRAVAASEKAAMEERNRAEILQRIAEHIKNKNVGAANLLLKNSLNNGALKGSEAQVSALVDELQALTEQEKKRRRNALEQTKSRIQDLIKQRNFAEAISAGQAFLDSQGFEKEIADLVKRAGVASASDEVLQKQQLAEVLTVRELLSRGKAREAKQVLETAIRQGVIRQDSEIASLQDQIDAALRIGPKEHPAIHAREVEEAALRRRLALRAPIAIGIAVILLLGSYGIHRLWNKPETRPKTPVTPALTTGPEVDWLALAQKKVGESPHQYKNAVDLLNKILTSSTAQQATKLEANDLLQKTQLLIRKEDELLDKANQALLQRDCKNAALLFGQALEMNADRLGEAGDGLEKTHNPANCEVNPSVIVSRQMKDADQAFRRHDWERAKALYESVTRNPAASNSDKELATKRISDSSKALEEVRRTEEGASAKAEELKRLQREEEERWNEAVQAQAGAGEETAKLEYAKSLFVQVASYGLAHKPAAEARVGEIEKKIDAIHKQKIAKCTQDWTALSTDFNKFKDSRDSAGLLSLKAKLENFSKSPCPQEEVEQAGSVANQIPSLVKGWQASPPPTADPREQDKRAITDLIEVQLSDAFRRRDIKGIQRLSPYSNKSDLDSFKLMFEGAKEFSRNCKISKWDFRGNDEAEVSGTYSGEFVGAQGQRQQRNGTFDIRVLREGAGWIIKNITW